VEGAGNGVRPGTTPEHCDSVSSLTGDRCKRGARSAARWRMEFYRISASSLVGGAVGFEARNREGLSVQTLVRRGEDEMPSVEANSLVRSHGSRGSPLVTCAGNGR